MMSRCCHCRRLLVCISVGSPVSKYASLARPTFKVRKGTGVSGYLLATIPVVAFGLGTWQVQRKKWKEDMIESLKARTRLPSTELPHDLTVISEMEFQKVRVKGHFDHSKEMYIRPRSLIKSKGESMTGLLSSGQVGSWIVTPFILADRDCTILVNRGWVPNNKLLQSQRSEKLVNDDIELEGLVRLTEKRVPLASKFLTSDFVSWNRRDLEAMAAASGCQPIFIDAVAESSQPGGPIGGQTRVTLRNEHVSYILTWYTLSAATGLLWYFKIFKKPL